MAEGIRWRRAFVLILLSLLVLPPIVFSAWAWAALHFAYSVGQRAGYVQKISRRGWVCKTWEGELAMATLPGTMPQIFNFTVRDNAVAAQIESTIGQRVSLEYEEHIGLPSKCFGETGHFVIGVKPVNDAVAPAPLPAPDAPSVRS